MGMVKAYKRWVVNPKLFIVAGDFGSSEPQKLDEGVWCRLPWLPLPTGIPVKLCKPLHRQDENINNFFDPSTYQKKNLGVGVKTHSPQWFERHTTRENIAVFFDPATYRQKRSAPSEASSAPLAVKPKTMSAGGLVEKFKLAAQLNGIEWDALAASSLDKIICAWVKTTQKVLNGTTLGAWVFNQNPWLWPLSTGFCFCLRTYSYTGNNRIYIDTISIV